jgi:hypothetical protein
MGKVLPKVFMRAALVLFAASVVATGTVHGQGVVSERSTARLAMGGVGGFLTGAAVGGTTGYALYVSSCPCQNDIRWLAAMAGAGAGGTIGIPVGVQLANDRRGSFGVAVLGSAAALGLGIGAMHVVHAVAPNSAVYFPLGAAIPVLQTGLSIKIHRMTQHRQVR